MRGRTAAAPRGIPDAVPAQARPVARRRVPVASGDRATRTRQELSFGRRSQRWRARPATQADDVELTNKCSANSASSTLRALRPVRRKLPSLISSSLCRGWRFHVDDRIRDLGILCHQSILDDMRKRVGFDERHRPGKPDVKIEEHVVR